MKTPVLVLGAAALLAVQTSQETRSGEPAAPVVIASKPFGESYLLAEMAAQLLESRGIAVERRLGLGTTEILFQALVAGDVDLYPEYTGTALLTLLGEEPEGGARAVYRRVSSESERRFGLHWLPPLGFENLYAIAVRRDVAERLELRTLSDLAAAGPELVAGLSPDFVDREDGLVGLSRSYGLEFAETKVLLQAVKYQAVDAGAVDLIDAYSTDGALARHDLVVLADDRGFFPPYEAAYLAGPALAAARPGVLAALARLSGQIGEGPMREWNARVELGEATIAGAAADALSTLGVVGPARATADVDRSADPPSLPGYLWSQRRALLELTRQHLLLVALSMAAAIGLALPLGLILHRLDRPAETVIGVVGVLQTLPGIALLAFMVPLLGIGALPAVVALFFYSVFPILRNTYTGLKEADRGAAQAAWSLGMTPTQLLLQVRLPLAAPVIMAGIRTATVLNVGTSTLAAFIGGGGLGDPIVRGLALSNTDMILSGAIPAAALAFAMDGLLAWVGRLSAPRGLRSTEA